jgi:magnesium transporter
MTKFLYKPEKEKGPEILETYRPHTWVHIEKAARQDLKQLVDDFLLDEGIIFDALDVDEVPRIETEGGVIYYFARYVIRNEQNTDTAPILLIIKKDLLITITPSEFPRMDRFLDGKVSYTTRDTTTLLLKVLAQIDQTYAEYLTDISKNVRLSTVRLDKIKNRDIIQFVEIEHSLNDVNSSLVRMNATFIHLLSGKVLQFSEEERDLMEDLSLNSAQQIQITKENLQLIVNIRDAYSTIMTNNLNRIIKLFTSLTVILTIPTIIGTFYGMNVRLPYQDHPEAFTLVVLISIILCIGSILLFNYKDWL